MARIRSVHPGLFTDEAFVRLSMAARVLLIGVWTEADDNGIFELNTLKLKMRLFPADAVDVPALLAELNFANLICEFETGGKLYGAIRNFRKFQRPKSPKAVHPIPQMLLQYVGLEPASSEMTTAEVIPFPQNGEMSPQMEEGGGRMEEEGGKETAAGDAGGMTNLPSHFEASQRVIEALGGDPEDPGWFSQRWLVGKWIAAGWNLELDILPTCSSMAEKRKRKGRKPIFSFSYCEEAIADAHASRMAPLPQGTPEVRNVESSPVRAALERRIASIGGASEVCPGADPYPSGVILESETP